MFLSTNTCSSKGDCIKQCPTKSIRLINGKAFSCLTCGICYKNCPNGAIFVNNYGGYVVDRAKCNGCGMCMYNCPTNNITIEDGVVWGICSRCGVCSEVCPSRIDGLDIEKDKQLKLIKSLNILYQDIPHKKQTARCEVTRNYIKTDLDECILCGRCSMYCPTRAIEFELDRDDGICSECRICSDVCPNGSINKNQIVNKETCTLCLNCLKNCPNEAIAIKDFKINVNKINQKPAGYIISCLNCGLCSTLDESLISMDDKIKYDPSRDNGEFHENAIENCPVNTLYENNELCVYNEVNDSLISSLSGFCVSCGKCVQVCDVQNARSFTQASWDGNVSDECISCGICCEVCPKKAITLHRGTIEVDLDKCILCENCAIHCPVGAIPKTTMYKAEISGGFNLIDQKLCMHCGLCYKICPYDAVESIGEEFVVNEEKCTYCGACKNSCPANAFIFERNFKDSLEEI